MVEVTTVGICLTAGNNSSAADVGGTSGGNIDVTCQVAGLTVGNLTAKLDESSRRRQFRILPGSGGKSYAKDIAHAYGLTKEEILQSRKN